VKFEENKMSMQKQVLKPLKVSFKEGTRSNSFLFTQVERNDRVAMYHVTMPKNDIHVGYEVFVIENCDLNKLSPKEKYPKDRDFGKTAFSFATFEMAKHYFEKLKKEK
jgi:hypothetical protein